MISSLQGITDEIVGQVATVNVHGIGYEVFCSARLIEQLGPGAESRMVIYTDVGQDHIRLYGFVDQLEKQTFLLLLRVKGVGPRSAADIVSRIDCRELLRIVSAGDIDKLQTVRGIGKKTSERIVVELKDRVGDFVAERHSPLASQVEREVGPVEEAVQALQALGFIRKDAERAVEAAQQGSGAGALDAGRLVKDALRFV